MTMILRVRLFLVTVCALTAGWLLAPTIVSAADTGLVVEGSSEFIITKPIWTMLTGLVLPFVVALITKASASSTFKGVIGIILAALAALIERATLTDGGAVFTSALLFDVLMVYGPQLLTYLGVWKQVDLNSKIAPTKGLS